MALGDITLYQQSSGNGGRGSRTLIVAASAGAPVILAGEPVTLVAGASSVATADTNLTTLASPYVPYSVTGTGLVGIAETSSNETTSAAGTVSVLSPQGNVFLINANTSASVNTQAKYDALVGHRVLIDKTAGVYTLLTTDSALNGCIILPLDIVKFPGKIAFKFVDGITV